MPQTLYALLAGIDRYRPPVPPLNGCVNDIQALAAFLQELGAGGEFALEFRILKDDEATRPAIIDGFRSHLRRAGPEDVALFYYSGHGSQEDAPPEFWHLEPDRLDETLVCYDSREEGQWDLADKELAALIAEIAERNPPSSSCSTAATRAVAPARPLRRESRCAAPPPIGGIGL